MHKNPTPAPPTLWSDMSIKVAKLQNAANVTKLELLKLLQTTLQRYLVLTISFYFS